MCDLEGFFFGDGQGVKEVWIGVFPETPFALVRADLVELEHPEIQVGLQVTMVV